MVVLLLPAMLAACSTIGNPEGWSGAAVSDDALYIGTREGTVRAIYLGRAEDGEMVPEGGRELGEIIWEFELRGDEQFRAVYGTPAVFEDVVYVGGYDGYLYALSREGDPEFPRQPKLLWQERVGRGVDDDVDPIVATPVVAEGLLLVASSDGYLYAYDVDARAEVWRFRTGDKVWSTPVVGNGVVYFGSMDKNVYAVSLEDGTELWRYRTDGAVVAAPAHAEGRIYIGSLDSVFYALNAASGVVEWRFEGANSWFWGEAIVSGGIVLAPSLDGNLYALDAGTGALRWTVETEGAIVGSPAVVFDMVAIPSNDGRIRLARLRDGAQLDACNLGEKVRTPLVEKDGHIYFAAKDHSIRSLRIKSNGNPDEIWVHLTNKDDPIPRGRSIAC
ncbi:MAG: PQQ-binding-like beta-propeller repeat protein [Chloroflexi bacterium]|nr:PQQ-binding-like beta-propeller repeat protein [Chloroflexota bacterium]